MLKRTENVIIVIMSVWIVLVEGDAYEDDIELIVLAPFGVVFKLDTDGAQVFVIFEKLLVIPIDETLADIDAFDGEGVGREFLGNLAWFMFIFRYWGQKERKTNQCHMQSPGRLPYLYQRRKHHGEPTAS